MIRVRGDIDAVTAQLRKRDEEAKRLAGGTEVKENPAHKELQTAARQLRGRLDEVEKRLWVPENGKGILPEVDLQAKVEYVSRSIGSSWDAPTPAQLVYLEQAEKLGATVLADVNRLFAEDVPAFRAKVQQAQIELLPALEPIQVPGARP